MRRALCILPCACLASVCFATLAAEEPAPLPAPVPKDHAGPPLPEILTLEQAQEIALSGHPSIAEADARVRQAQERFHIVRSSFLPTIGVRSAWMHSDLPDQFTDSSLQSPAEIRSQFDSANGNWKPGDALQSYLNSPVRDGMNAWADGELGQFLLDPANRPSGPIIPRSDLENLLSFLQSQQDLSKAQADDVADALQASYINATLGDTPTTYAAGADASWMVFGGFSRMFRRAAAIHGKEQTLASRRDAERLLRGGVAAAYYQAQYAREQLTIAEGDLAFSERMATEASRGKDAGTTSSDDLLDAQVRRNSAESTLLEARRQYQASRATLAGILALPADGLPDSVQLAPLPPDSERELTIPDAEVEIAYALANRPDVAAARYTEAVHKDQKGLSRSTFYPDVWLTGGYNGWRKEDINFEQQDFGWNVALIASLDIFRGGARLATVKERVAAVAVAEAQVRQHELDAMTDVRNALSTLASSGQQLRLQTENLALVERYHKLAVMEHEAGTIPAIKLYDAEHRLVAAQQRRASALVALHAAWQSLQQATARSLDQESPPQKDTHAQP